MNSKIQAARVAEHIAIALAVTATLIGASVQIHAQNRISNARIETRSAAQGLDREMSALAGRIGVTWAGYRVPMIAGPRRMCCYDTFAGSAACCGACRLESGTSVTLTTGNDQSRAPGIPLESPTEILVLARYEGGAITRLRTFTPDCDVDAGGMPLVWLNDVRSDDSVSWLSALAGAAAMHTADFRSRVARPALAALSLHTTRGALTSLLTLAKNDKNAHVRADALFWLSQRAGEEAVKAITDAIVNDPETDVRKRAVFALSQLPSDEGIPKLIEVARTNRNPEVRKQAFFWLGQTKDPRAIQLFEEILLKP